VHVTGCSDNKILGIAIAASLIQPDEDDPQYNDYKNNLLSGKRPPKSIINMLNAGTPQTLVQNIQWSHPFTFSNWTCIKPDGTAPSGMTGASHWIWVEGSPNEILKWKNHRVLVLGKSPFPRKFEPIRVFEGLSAKVKIHKILSEEELDKFVREISATEENVREEAIKEHKKWQP